MPSAELDRIGDAAAELVSEAVAAGRLPRSPSAELMALAGGMVLSARAAAR